MKTIKELVYFLMEYIMDDKYLVVMKTIGNGLLSVEDIEQKTGFSQGLIKMYIEGKRYKFFKDGDKLVFKRLYQNVSPEAIDPGKHTSKLGLLDLGLIEHHNSKYKLSNLGNELLSFIK